MDRRRGHLSGVPRTLRGSSRARRPVVLSVVFIWILVVAEVSSASPLIHNWMGGELQLGPAGIVPYDYSTGTPVEVADFTGGTHTGTAPEAGTGALTLGFDYGTTAPDTTSEPWWDKDWRSRRCVQVDHADVPGVATAQSLEDYQFRIELDTATLIAAGWFDADGSDLRTVRSDGAGGFVELSHWTEPWTLDTATTVVWVQLDQLDPGTTSFCLYYNNVDPVPDLSDQLAVFTYDTQKPLYYTVSGEYAADDVRIAGYAPSTTFHRDGQPDQTVAGGAVTTVGGNAPASVYFSDGPLSSVGLINATDALVPASFASTEFVVPTNRGVQTFTIRSPWASTTVQFFDGTAPTGAPVTVNPGSGAVTVTRDVGDNRAALATSTNGVPFLLTHVNTANQDSIVARPPTTDDLFGIFSRHLFASPDSGPTTLRLEQSDGVANDFPAASPNALAFVSNTGVPGTDNGGGPAVRVTNLGAPGAAIQQRDDDGVESSTFWPLSELNTRYLVPTSSRYIAIACPFPGTIVSIAGGATQNCAGANHTGGFIGKYRDLANRAVGGAAIDVSANAPIYVYFEQLFDGGDQDETNVNGMVQGRQFTFPTPTTTVQVDEGSYDSGGTWESDPINTGGVGVFGLADAIASLPGDSVVEFRLASSTSATGPWAFTGPVDDPAGWYTAADLPIPAAHLHDGDGSTPLWIRWQVRLVASSDCESPTVSELEVKVDLDPFVRTVDQRSQLSASVAGLGGSRLWVARIVSTGVDGGSVALRHEEPTAPGALAPLDASAALVPGGDQINVNAGTATQVGTPLALASGDTTSVSVSPSLGAPGDPPPWLFSWDLTTAAGPVVSHPFTVDFAP